MLRTLLHLCRTEWLYRATSSEDQVMVLARRYRHSNRFIASLMRSPGMSPRQYLALRRAVRRELATRNGA